MNKKNLWWAIGLLIALPGAAYANAGTPLIWAICIHLWLGNLIIGLLEGAILTKFFHVKALKTKSLMIVANYFSMICGGLLFDYLLSRLSLDIYNINTTYWLAVLYAYVFTLILEFPFIALVFRGESDWLQRAVKASLAVQTVSYILLFGWYWLASGKTVLRDMEPVPLASIKAPEDVQIYYISEEDGNVYTRTLTEETPSEVFDLSSSGTAERLYLQASSTNDEMYDLIAVMDTQPREVIPIQEAVLPVSVAPDYHENSGWYGFGKVPKLGITEESPWEFHCEFWAARGLLGTNTKANKNVSAGVELPGVMWYVRNPQHLLTDKVLLQLKNQICLYDPNTKEIALIAKGRGPIAILKNAENPK